MCRILYIKSACCELTLKCRYSKCRGTFSKAPLSDRWSKVLCKSIGYLTLSAKHECGCKSWEQRLQYLDETLGTPATIEQETLGRLQLVDSEPTSKHLAVWGHVQAQAHQLHQEKAEHPRQPRQKHYPRVFGHPKRRAFKPSGSKLKHEVRPREIMALTDDFDPMPWWIWVIL